MRVAVTTDIHANLPSQRGVRARRGAGHPDDLRQLRLRHRPGPGGLRLRLPHRPRARAGPALGRLDPCPHERALQGVRARPALRPPRRCGRPGGAARARLAAQGQPVPVRGQARLGLRAPGRPGRRRLLVFGHTHKPWIHEYGGVLFVNCGSVGKPKDGDPRGAFAVLELADGRVEASIERSPTTPKRSRARSRPSGFRASLPSSS
jgi:Calcineurin-like phosphoesterase superfamily domain